MPRRSYDQYCAVARALDAVGDRWTLLIARELLGGPRRYTDLHADLPGVSTDMLASRLKDMERDDLLTRRRLPRPGTASVYELTARGRALLPVLAALADWGAPALDEQRPTDAVRAHWFAVPLLARLARYFADAPVRVIDIALDEGAFHIVLDPDDPTAGHYADGPAPHPDTALRMTAATCAALAHDRFSLAEALAAGWIDQSHPDDHTAAPATA